ncbi:hypothetical protein PBPRA0785 [Photobacterium profundum SS9]|uniref:Uncharacterized protein n=1 Tax=Photobacterium profundum (strain SS9) TaxID=298386 RepID=Q6LU27_PHOPR|nr:hypothetical protein PBPRA0785 [Photobacterium profundum SS9]
MIKPTSLLLHMSKSDLPFTPIIIQSEINIISPIETNDEKAVFIRHYQNSHLLCISGKTIKKIIGLITHVVINLHRENYNV